jgi:hypothetical protein
MYEHHWEPLLPRSRFLVRVFRHGGVALLLLVGSLLIGILGYHWTEGLSWIDSLLNASMILGGMGPVDTLRTVPGKIFASAYSLFAGMLFLVVAGIIVAPVVHRFLHQLHLEKRVGSS